MKLTPEQIEIFKSQLFVFGATSQNDEVHAALHDTAVSRVSRLLDDEDIEEDEQSDDVLEELAIEYKSGFWSLTHKSDRDAMRAALVLIRDYPAGSNSEPDDMGEALDSINDIARRGLGEEITGQESANMERSAWASVAICAHQATTGGEDEHAICDLLTNLGHYCEANQIDFANELRRACDHYRAESNKRLC